MNSYKSFIYVFVSKVVKYVRFKASVITASNETLTLTLMNHTLNMNTYEY